MIDENDIYKMYKEDEGEKEEETKFLGSFRGIDMFGNSATEEAIQYYKTKWENECKKSFELEINQIKPPTFWQLFLGIKK